MGGMKACLMEASRKDKVNDVAKKILTTANESDEDVHVTSEGKVLKGNEELEICGVRDGSTVQVVSRPRGGGKHKDKKSKSEKIQAANPKRQQEQKCEEEQKSDDAPLIQRVDKKSVIRQLE